MTYFPENLAILRKRAGYTQETLAEALGVSRQAVGKWESGQGMPEAATLLILADLLGCSLDQLMRLPLEEVAETEGLSSGMGGNDWVVFSQHMARFSLQMALGVALVLAGVALTIAASAFFDSGLVALPLLLLVAVAVFLFVFGGIDHGNFQKAYPVQPPCPYPDEEGAFDSKFRGGIAAAVAGVLVSVALLVAAVALFNNNETMVLFATAGFMGLLAACVGVMVWLGIQHYKYHPEPPKSKAARDAGGVIMLLATAVYLLLGFVGHLWHPGWVVFPIAAILCAIVDKKEED